MVLNLKQASKPQMGRGRKMSKPQQGFAKLRKAALEHRGKMYKDIKASQRRSGGS